MASGEFNDQLKAEFTATIERLLAENAAQQAASAETVHAKTGD